MRFVPTNCLRDGMVLGKSLFGNDQSLLLGTGQMLKDTYIQKIKKLGYQGVYINDSLSDEIEVESLISDQLKVSAVKAIKDVFIISGNSENKADDAISATKEIVDGLINEILFNRNLMVNMVDLKIFDDYTFYHSVNVAVLSLIIGIALDLPRPELYKLGLGALLHDIGKVFISKEILSKEGPLDIDEFDEIRKHPTLGYEYLTAHFDVPSKSNLGALQHHERYDGSGYPDNLKEQKISDFGRIIAVADVYDALTSNRPYRKALLPSDAMEYVMGGSGTMFDPKYVLLFTRKVAAYPLGTIVRLSNGVDGIVVRNYEDCCTRPRLRLVNDNNPDEHIYVDLRDDLNAINLTITEIVAR